MNSKISEVKILEALIPDLQAKGYDVFLRPSKDILPPFLEGYIPDAVAIPSSAVSILKNLAIEVVHKSNHAEKKVEHLNHLFKDRSNWELRVLWVSPLEKSNRLNIQSSQIIQSNINEVSSLVNQNHYNAAFLILWATFEALGRKLLPNDFEKPQTPRRVVQTLAQEGYITPNQADNLRTLAEKRNTLIHGGLEINISKLEVSSFLETIREINNDH